MYVYVCVCMYIYVCMYVCMCVCMCVYVCMSVWICVYVCIYMYACISVHIEDEGGEVWALKSSKFVFCFVVSDIYFCDETVRICAVSNLYINLRVKVLECFFPLRPHYVFYKSYFMG
jgi:hypothetical protein